MIIQKWGDRGLTFNQLKKELKKYNSNYYIYISGGGHDITSDAPRFYIGAIRERMGIEEEIYLFQSDEINRVKIGQILEQMEYFGVQDCDEFEISTNFIDDNNGGGYEYIMVESNLNLKYIYKRDWTEEVY